MSSSSSCFLTEGMTSNFVLLLSQKWGGCEAHPIPCSPKANYLDLTPAQEDRLQIGGFVDAGARGCSVMDFLPVRDV